MCGLAGYSAAPRASRLELVRGLGLAIDDRGGDGAGYVSVGQGLKYGRNAGTWEGSRERFVRAAASGDLCMLHSRMATCSVVSERTAHPFCVKRDGRAVLWGAHNGMISNARESARRNHRGYSVDSLELFELLADGDHDAIRRLSGYGVITWVEAADRKVMYFCKLSGDAEFVLERLSEGGLVWGSTQRIIHRALTDAGLEAVTDLAIKTGIVYRVDGDVVSQSGREDLRLGSWWSWDEDEQRGSSVMGTWGDHAANSSHVSSTRNGYGWTGSRPTTNDDDADRTITCSECYCDFHPSDHATVNGVDLDFTFVCYWCGANVEDEDAMHAAFQDLAEKELTGRPSSSEELSPEDWDSLAEGIDDGEEEEQLHDVLQRSLDDASFETWLKANAARRVADVDEKEANTIRHLIAEAGKREAAIAKAAAEARAAEVMEAAKRRHEVEEALWDEAMKKLDAEDLPDAEEPRVRVEAEERQTP